MHVWLLHGTAVPQAPFDWHVCTPLPEHWVWPEVQVPVQAPFMQVDPEQAVPVLHCPFDWQVCTLLPEHCVLRPACRRRRTHRRSTRTGRPPPSPRRLPTSKFARRCPSIASHRVCTKAGASPADGRPGWCTSQANHTFRSTRHVPSTPLPEQVVWLGAQAPVQAPDTTQVQVAACCGGAPRAVGLACLHAVAGALRLARRARAGARAAHARLVAARGRYAPKLPSDWHVCTPLPEHWVAAGTQTPVHLPLTHAELLQATAVPQVPLELQVCTPLPEHRVVPGVHEPVHDPFTQAWLEHAAAFCQVPVLLQV